MTTNDNMNHNQTGPMFSAIAHRYDLCNHLFSFGKDFHWRNTAVKLACQEPIANALDICCGTGDMAFALVKTGHVKSISGCDVSRPMLDIAKNKFKQKKTSLFDASLTWHCKPAENTDLASASFNLITCAFGLRNINDLSAALTEAHRLLKPGGMFCILEFSLPKNRLLRELYLFYLGRIMPLLGRLIAGSSEPWRYLYHSIQRWSNTVNLKDCLHRAGFSDIIICSLTFGIVQIHLAKKP